MISGKSENATMRKDAIKQALLSKMGNAFEEESQKASQILCQERENAIKVIIEEQKKAILELVENEKKAIWATAMELKQLEDYDTEVIRDIMGESILGKEVVGTGGNGHSPSLENHQLAVSEDMIELEILPPRDQNEIAMINTYLINMPELSKVELITQVDKSIFKVVQKEPVNLVERLNKLPQIVSAKDVIENNQKKITITLLAKSKLDRNNTEMAEKVNKIFYKKK